jgi:hypothetical protein
MEPGRERLTRPDDEENGFSAKIPPPSTAEKNISKKSAEFQKHVQFFHLPAIEIEGPSFFVVDPPSAIAARMHPSGPATKWLTAALSSNTPR